jgi:hypothetical protein
VPSAHVRLAGRPRGYNIVQTTPHRAGGGVVLEKNTWVYIGRRGAETAEKVGGSVGGRKLGGREWAGEMERESLAGKKENTTCAMPTVSLGICIACDVILAGGTNEKWSCAMPTVPLGIDVTLSRLR